MSERMDSSNAADPQQDIIQAPPPVAPPLLQSPPSHDELLGEQNAAVDVEAPLVSQDDGGGAVGSSTGGIVELVDTAPPPPPVEGRSALGAAVEETPSISAAGRYDVLDTSNTDDMLEGGGGGGGGEVEIIEGAIDLRPDALDGAPNEAQVPTAAEANDVKDTLPMSSAAERPPTATPSRRGSQKDVNKSIHRRPIPAPLVMRPGSGKSVASASSLADDHLLCDYDGSRSPNHHPVASSVSSSYRIPMAVTPSTRATTPASYFIPPPTIASVPVKTTATGTVVRVRSVVNECYDALSSDAPPELLGPVPDGHVATGPKLVELVSAANSMLAHLPSTLGAMLAHDTQRVREVMTMFCAFLTTFSAAAHAAVDDETSTSQSSTGVAGNGQRLHRDIQRHRPKRTSQKMKTLDAQLQAFFPPPSIVQVTVPLEGRHLDIARVAHDGSQRISMHRVPLSVALASTAVEEKRAAWEHAQRTGRCASPSSPSAQPNRQAVGASGGSPSKNRCAAAIDAPPEQNDGSDAEPSAAPDAVAKRVVACRKAADALSMAQEHCALVQLYLDASAVAMAPQPKPSATIGHRLGSPAQKTHPSSSTQQQQDEAALPSPSTVVDTLANMRADLTRQINDTDKQLRALKNTPSLVAATKAHQLQRIVSVDKEDVLHRDRLQLRASLDVVSACMHEREHFLTLLREERRLFQTSTQSLKSSTAGRDDELAAKNKAYLGLHVKYRELSAEHAELKDMVRTMVEHVEQLERRIDASKRINPQPALFATSSVSAAHSGGGGVGTSFAGHTVSSLNGSLEVPRNSDSPLRKRSPSPLGSVVGLDGTRSSSAMQGPSIYNVAPDLSMPRRLSSLQQTDLFRRLHDKPLSIRRSYEESVKRTSSRGRKSSRSPPFMCGRSHSVPVHEQLGSGLMPPTVEELNQRLYSGRKGQREALRNVLFQKLEAEEAAQEALRPLRLKGKPGTTPQDVQQCVEKLYTKSVEERMATRTKLFEELVLELERPYSPKKLQRSELEETVKRLSGAA